MWNEAWNREIAYNDPKAQMQRLRNAGINPHLAYMQGGMNNAANTGELPKYEQQGLEVAPSLGENLGGILTKYLQNQSIIKQLRRDEALTRQEEIRADIMKSGLDEKIYAEFGS